MKMMCAPCRTIASAQTCRGTCAPVCVRVCVFVSVLCVCRLSFAYTTLAANRVALLWSCWESASSIDSALSIAKKKGVMSNTRRE